MILWLQTLLLIFLGLGSGIIVGTGIVALLLVLDAIPRLIQLSHGRAAIRALEGAIIAGTVWFTLMDLFQIPIPLMPGMKHLVLIVVGLFMGIFVGMLAAALTEILNVIPIIARRMGMEGQLLPLLMALALGKVLGSLLQWLFQIP